MSNNVYNNLSNKFSQPQDRAELLPAWDNSTEYRDFLADDFKSDVEQVKNLIAQINSINSDYSKWMEKSNESASADLIGALQLITRHESQAHMLLYNMVVFARTAISLDSKNEIAIKTLSQLMQIQSELEISIKPYQMYLSTTLKENFDLYLKNDLTQKYKFFFSQEREQSKYLLSKNEENLISSLKASGHTSWDNLYSALTGSIKCTVIINGVSKNMGLSEAKALGLSADEPTRKAAWTAVQEAWGEHKESAAAILNSLADWRLQLSKKRSQQKPHDFLTDSLSRSRIKKETLEAMMKAVETNKPAIQEIHRKMAKVMKKKQMDPWDIVSSAPISENKKYSFAEGFKQIKESFSEFEPAMGQFAQTMLDNKWIDSRLLPNKGGGAYCTGFAKSRTPRVFQSFMGSSQDISTLAHELGHAYHSWVMRDLSLVENKYPMTLAETASIFSENILFQYQIKHAKTEDEKLDVAWSMAEGAVSLLLNIPTRYEFEKNFYEKRKEGFVSVNELSKLMGEAFTKWYGDTLSKPDELFWAHKMHFSFADVSFYNYPYTFGYLFSLSLMARRQSYGDNFHSKYVEILRDTGRMTAEDLVQKHLGEDITQEKFWDAGIKYALSTIPL
jgi:oligoendopeptidase F